MSFEGLPLFRIPVCFVVFDKCRPGTPHWRLNSFQMARQRRLIRLVVFYTASATTTRFLV